MTNIFKRTFITWGIAIAAVIVFLPLVALAQNWNAFNPIGHSSLFCFLRDVLAVVLRIGIVVAAIFIVYSGYLFVSAGGDTTKLKDARVAFFGAVIGTAVLLGSWVLAAALVGTINVLRPDDQKIQLDGCSGAPGESGAVGAPGENARVNLWSQPNAPTIPADPNATNSGSNTNNPAPPRN